MNFALILFLITLATGILWLIDVLYARKLRAPGSKNPIWVEWAPACFRSFWPSLRYGPLSLSRSRFHRAP